MFKWLFNKKKNKIQKENQSIEYGPTGLKDLINLRDAFYHESTMKIIDVMDDNVFQAAREVLDPDTSKYTEWVSVEILPPDHIAVLGVCTYPIGCQIQLSDEEEIVINQTNQETYKRLIKLGIPITLAEKGTLREIKEYMKEKSDGSLPINEEPKVTAADFSFDDLTPEQQEQLKHFSQHSKDKVN